MPSPDLFKDVSKNGSENEQEESSFSGEKDDELAKLQTTTFNPKKGGLAAAFELNM